MPAAISGRRPPAAVTTPASPSTITAPIDPDRHQLRHLEQRQRRLRRLGHFIYGGTDTVHLQANTITGNNTAQALNVAGTITNFGGITIAGGTVDPRYHAGRGVRSLQPHHRQRRGRGDHQRPRHGAERQPDGQRHHPQQAGGHRDRGQPRPLGRAQRAAQLHLRQRLWRRAHHRAARPARAPAAALSLLRLRQLRRRQPGWSWPGTTSASTCRARLAVPTATVRQLRGHRRHTTWAPVPTSRSAWC